MGYTNRAVSLIPYMQHWPFLRSIKVRAEDSQETLTALASFTQLQHLAFIDESDEHVARSIACLSALSGLQSLSLRGRLEMQGGLSAIAQACTNLTQLKLVITDNVQPL